MMVKVVVVGRGEEVKITVGSNDGFYLLGCGCTGGRYYDVVLLYDDGGHGRLGEEVEATVGRTMVFLS